MPDSLVGGSASGLTDLGDMQTFSEDITSNMWVSPTPGSGSDNVDVSDATGVVRKINVSYIRTDTDANLTTFETNLRNLQNGNQTPITYTTDVLPGGILVKVDALNINFVAGPHNKTEYTLSLIECNNNG